MMKYYSKNSAIMPEFCWGEGLSNSASQFMCSNQHDIVFLFVWGVIAIY